jgi:hypothetical protein
MATGFTSNEQKKTKKSTGYKTMFERISEATNGESKSFIVVELLPSLQNIKRIQQNSFGKKI